MIRWQGVPAARFATALATVLAAALAATACVAADRAAETPVDAPADAPARAPADAQAGAPGDAPADATTDATTVAPAAALVITCDTRLEPGRRYGKLVIGASGITVEGAGAEIVGATSGAPRDFTGTGVSAAGVSGVTLRGLRVRGFAVGLAVNDASGWTIEDCDFSDNFHDPDFGWGEQERRGGIVLANVDRSVLRRNRASRVWDGCSLSGCDDDVLEANDFSHASNTCLKLRESCRNRITGNDLSWGLRIAPGETHARDSTGVLIESGSHDNLFSSNDVTHGGDGIFVRVLNGWTSTGNVFERNDCSFANNNGFEAWSPGNTWVGNTANHCSYGFWLGASDDTRLLGNEAAWNGDPGGFHNAPEAFGHGGIVFVNGPSSHTVVDGNRCHDNAGGGIVLRGDLATEGGAWKAFHWVIQRNVLERNRWGLFVQHADWIDVGPNEFADNRDGDLHDAGGVTHLVRRAQDRPADANRRPPEVMVRPSSAGPWCTGEPVVLQAITTGGADLACRWDLGDGTVAEGPRVEHRWRRAGRMRVGVTVNDGVLAGLAHLDALVHDGLPELGTEPAGVPGKPGVPGVLADWSVSDETGASAARFGAADPRVVPPVVGAGAVHAHVEPYGGGRVGLLWPASRDAGRPLTGASELIVWLRVRNPNLPAWQDGNPVITIFESDGRWLRLAPARDLLGSPADIEGRDGWSRLAVPLAGDALWLRDGPGAATLNWLTLGVDSWGWPPLDIWVDGLSLR